MKATYNLSCGFGAKISKPTRKWLSLKTNSNVAVHYGSGRTGTGEWSNNVEGGILCRPWIQKFSWLKSREIVGDLWPRGSTFQQRNLVGEAIAEGSNLICIVEGRCGGRLCRPRIQRSTWLKSKEIVCDSEAVHSSNTTWPGRPQPKGVVWCALREEGAA